MEYVPLLLKTTTTNKMKYNTFKKKEAVDHIKTQFDRGLYRPPGQTLDIPVLDDPVLLQLT